MRLFNVSQFPQAMKSFNLRREAAPHATLMRRKALSLFRTRFNLRREAAPHATVHFRHVYSVNVLFQSQTRSRSTCDTVVLRYEIVQRVFQSQTRSRSTCDTNNQTRQNNFCGVSISDEKPLH